MVRVSGGKRRAGHSELESVYPIRRFGKPALVQGVTYALAASIVTVSRCGKGSPSAQRSCICHGAGDEEHRPVSGRGKRQATGYRHAVCAVEENPFMRVPMVRREQKVVQPRGAPA